MKQAPLVSIALCTYNGAKYLADQLDTLVNQTYKTFEIVVVDDCSTDSTVQILNDYASRYPQITVYKNESNLGFTSNFEKAVKLCNGEFIALCDQDDLWDLQKIELQVDAIKNNVFVYHDSEFIYEDGSAMNKKVSDIMNLYRGGEPEVFLFFNCVSGHSILMKKELLTDALPLKQSYFHDWWLAYVATNVGTIDFIPQCLVKYRQHDSSDTNILRQQRKNDKHKLSSVQKIERIEQWLAYCSAFPKNKDQQLIDSFYKAYKKRVQSYLSFELSALLFKYRKTIFYIRKKSKLNRLNYIYSQVWGVKTKKIFSQQ
ncbi:glycosyltransferase involved in cell wall biosynthesis [Mucilaginibacter frigoritolerans]|jgi:glycosyltransferase involved in cell wall biosynthesis|uniref:Glycosyltransferase involved in cell wall biosynthesis n=1 Tax=Mucilaginibacter frigoritolerans TaxID=652788 RepID=A0A562U289_9SPHI|nr:glycosyltransferase family 2 protein [Mucilaginibacter frigoritolerans]TWI99955.1 glycosyltransferase involved in cell wall biosynthesis [Mucilaginibacter frigoritolerans]